MPNTAHRNRVAKVSKADREQCFRTYGTRCHLCSYPGADTADHVKSVRAGGNTLLANLRPAHKTCNEFRGARPLSAELKQACRTRYELRILDDHYTA